LKKNVFANAQNPNDLIILGELGASICVIGRGGANDLYTTDDASRWHMQNLNSNYLIVDGHVESIKYDRATQTWGTRWRDIHFMDGQY